MIYAAIIFVVENADGLFPVKDQLPVFHVVGIGVPLLIAPNTLQGLRCEFEVQREGCAHGRVGHERDDRGRLGALD